MRIGPKPPNTGSVNEPPPLRRVHSAPARLDTISEAPGVWTPPSEVLERALELQASRQRADARLDPTARRTLRTARDENIDALMARSALEIVHGDGAVFRLLNPARPDAPDGYVVHLRGQAAHGIQQRYALLSAVGELLRTGTDRGQIIEMALQARKHAEAGPIGTGSQVAERALIEFLEQSQLRIGRALAEATNFEPVPGWDASELLRLANRLGRVRWLERELPDYLLRQPTTTFAQDMRILLAAGPPDSILEALDHRFEAVMTHAVKESVRAAGIGHIEAVKFEKLPRVKSTVQPQDVAAQRLPLDHENYKLLDELRTRLERGEVSAIGGSDYAANRYPREVLAQLARGEIHAIVYDGTKEAALEYLRATYGTDAQGTRQGCRLMGLTGLDGSGPRLLVTQEDGRRFLLVTGFGESRQLHNAGALLLFEEDGARAPAERIELAGDRTDLVAQLTHDVAGLFASEFEARAGQEVLGIKITDPAKIPTQLVILQNPGHLSTALRDNFTRFEPTTSTTVPMSIGYIKKGEQLGRLLLPKVGGNGLYGDTAGHFVTAFFKGAQGALDPNVVFSGTAGGFADTADTSDFKALGVRGLGLVRPGGLILPLGSVEQYGDPKPISLVRLFGPDPAAWPEPVRDAVALARASLTDNHVAVKAPAIETFTLMNELVGRGFASVDVEGGAISRAVEALRKENPSITFTPVYVHSDDPRTSADDPFDSLAMMGPFFEGTRFDPALYGVLVELLHPSLGPKQGDKA